LLRWQVCVTVPSFYWLRWVLRTFCPGWPQPVILLISASWVPKIIGLSHGTQPPERPFKKLGDISPLQSTVPGINT
jgi:hypothetical protein